MNMISKHLQKDLERQMIRVRALNSHRIKRVKASRPKNNFQVIKQMNNNTMHISASTEGQVLSLIESCKNDYRKKLGSKGACRHADPVSLSIAFGMNMISIELTYSEVTSPIGFPFNRLICKLRLDGAAISLKQLKKELNND
jgi:hypothetical protein